MAIQMAVHMCLFESVHEHVVLAIAKHCLATYAKILFGHGDLLTMLLLELCSLGPACSLLILPTHVWCLPEDQGQA